MIKYLKDDLFVLTEEQQEELYWKNWVHDSHKWIEEVKGYYRCEFCGRGHTSTMPIGIHQICENNPYLKRQTHASHG